MELELNETKFENVKKFLTVRKNSHPNLSNKKTKFLSNYSNQ